MTHAIPLIDELRVEAALVPARRGELYKVAADEIEELRDALKSIVTAFHTHSTKPLPVMQGYIGRAQYVLDKGQ